MKSGQVSLGVDENESTSKLLTSIEPEDGSPQR